MWNCFSDRFKKAYAHIPDKKLSGDLQRLSWHKQVIPAQDFIMATTKMIFDDIVFFSCPRNFQRRSWKIIPSWARSLDYIGVILEDIRIIFVIV